MRTTVLSNCFTICTGSFSFFSTGSLIAAPMAAVVERLVRALLERLRRCGRLGGLCSNAPDQTQTKRFLATAFYVPTEPPLNSAMSVRAQVDVTAGGWLRE